SDGTYSLSCPAATYSVAVAPVPPPDPLLQQSAAPAAPGVKLPAAYQEVATSGLVAEVKDGSVPIDFELDSKFKGSRR
ncbi:MAG TPA: hypothetical protein VM510_13775, partial [Caulifigura sp.]|nr:hypothetical protein [Caulifigura sp.]